MCILQKKAGYMQLLLDTPDITAYSRWQESKPLIDTDPRYHAVDTELLRAKWFNEYVNRLVSKPHFPKYEHLNVKKKIQKIQHWPLVLIWVPRKACF